MSWTSTSSQRNLTLTEELEKLEQSITLTLQEIDHNFSRAHRIVTTSILPIVEQYAEHSKNVWEGSKFWKQFFEASANVSLSGYEEPQEAEDETVTEENTTTHSTPTSSSYTSPNPNIQDGTTTPPYQIKHTSDDTTLSSSPTHSTPRAPRITTKPPPPTLANYPSPYETLKREIQGGPTSPPDEEPSNSTIPSTPRHHHPSLDSSPFLPPSTTRHQQQHTSQHTPANDILLHRILDKNWRLQATPHTQTRGLLSNQKSNIPYRSGKTAAETPLPNSRKGGKNIQDPESLDSSPAVPAPTLHSEIFDSPVRRPRVPGVSILTPARGGPKSTTTGMISRKGLGLDEKNIGGGNADIFNKGAKQSWDSDSDDEDAEGGMEGMMSPPKTMQFHIPQSRLLRTPAREASKKIVESLLLTAGGGDMTSELDLDLDIDIDGAGAQREEEEDSSPSVVKRGMMIDEDTF